MTQVTDGLGRNTDYVYDTLGNVTSVTRLASTGNAVTTSYTYDAAYSLLTGITDHRSALASRSHTTRRGSR